MREKIKNIGIVQILLVCLILSSINDAINIIPVDYHFIVTSGRYIVNNGIPKTNPWFVADGLPIVIQQWLYGVYMYYLDRIGIQAITLSEIVIALLMIALVSKLVDKNNISKALFICTIAFKDVLPYTIGMRPEAITVDLLLFQILCQEKYKERNNIKWLILIPLIMILDVNLHMSMWIMHICVMIPYLMPDILKNDNKLYTGKDRFLGIGILLLSALCALLNPYGLDGLNYTFKALTDNTFDFIGIPEVSSPSMSSIDGIIIVMQILIGCWLLYTRNIKSTTLYMSAGLLFLQCSAIRHMMFMPISLTFLFRDLFSSKEYDALKLKFHLLYNKYCLHFNDGIKSVLIVACSILLISSGIKFIVYKNSMFDLAFNSSVLDEYIQYIDSKDNKDVHIYTNFDVGSYFEYNGYNRIYIDPRPEIYNEKVVGDTDDVSILAEHCAVFRDGYDAEGNYLTDKDVEYVIDKYSFKYFVLHKGYDNRLVSYLYSNEDKYNRVMGDGDYELWERR